MTIGDKLAIAGRDRTDAEVLIAHALKRDRSWIIAHAGDVLDDNTDLMIDSMMERRRRGEPVAYITGSKEFFGRSFIVKPSVLIPRPATELLVEQALEALDGEKIEKIREIDTDIVAWSEIKQSVSDVKHIIDIGTGSGCIAVTLACERPDLHIIATDISEDALAVARANAERHQVSDRIIFRCESACESLETIDEPFLIVSNPPYIPEGTILEREVRDFEPATALFAGADGTDVLIRIVGLARKQPQCSGFVMECMTSQVS